MMNGIMQILVKKIINLEKRMKIIKSLGSIRKSCLNKVIKRDDSRWTYYFCGVSIKQLAIGIMWRIKK